MLHNACAVVDDRDIELDSQAVDVGSRPCVCIGVAGRNRLAFAIASEDRARHTVETDAGNTGNQFTRFFQNAVDSRFYGISDLVRVFFRGTVGSDSLVVGNRLFNTGHTVGKRIEQPHLYRRGPDVDGKDERGLVFTQIIAHISPSGNQVFFDQRLIDLDSETRPVGHLEKTIYRIVILGSDGVLEGICVMAVFHDHEVGTGS